MVKKQVAKTKNIKNKTTQQSLLERGVEHVFPEADFLARLKTGKPLRIKLGIDPTGPRIHLGHAVIFWKLREFQDLGHKIVIIFGDFTAKIGDPSDKLQRRPVLTDKEIAANVKTYKAQIGKILDLVKTEFRYNSEWLSKIKADEFIKLTQLVTVNQMLARRNFAERFAQGLPIGLNEFLYPLLQASDSVAIEADVEMGGTDQLFNLEMGRVLQEAQGQKPQVVFINQMLLGTDGRKMSKSWGNVINILDKPGEMFGKLMAMDDKQLPAYTRLAARLPVDEVQRLEDDLLSGKLHPKAAKMSVALRIVELYHTKTAAKKAAKEFERVFSKKEKPTDAPVVKLMPGPYPIIDLAIYAGLAKSRSEAKRLLSEGALKIGGEAIKDPQMMIEIRLGEITLLQRGKRQFVSLTA